MLNIEVPSFLGSPLGAVSKFLGTTDEWLQSVLKIIRKLTHDGDDDGIESCCDTLVNAAESKGDASCVAAILTVLERIADKHHRYIFNAGVIQQLTDLISESKHMKIKHACVRVLAETTRSCCIDPGEIADEFDSAQTGRVLDQYRAHACATTRGLIDELYERMWDTPQDRDNEARLIALELIASEMPKQVKVKAERKKKKAKKVVQKSKKIQPVLEEPKAKLPQTPPRIPTPPPVNHQFNERDAMSDDEMILMESVIEFIDHDFEEFGVLLFKMKREYV